MNRPTYRPRRLSRRAMIWIAVPLLLVTFAGCPKKKPVAKPADLDVETTKVPSQPSPATPTQDVAPPSQPAVTDKVETDLLESKDLAVVNEELKRRGFSADVYFDYDESTLSDDTRDKLARNSDLLKSKPQFSVTIEGHADSRGTNEYNLALGERRANAVKEYIASLGVSAERVRTISYGEERPVCTEDVESCWSQNRRAHMVISARSAG
jgi:peptidoglycan-associated lipoprotein